ncbi:MAG TPA: hypothetical protein H9951_20770 [Candidatus Bacteroides intestinigallinarum]|nr:hypothetical protein [Candidatus Bacteroides intestinigallinarum]
MKGDETSFFYAVLVKGGSSQYALAAIFILESTNYSKEFIDKINCMSGKYSRWAIFQDLTKVRTRIPLPLRWRDELSFFICFGERLFLLGKYGIIALGY